MGHADGQTDITTPFRVHFSLFAQRNRKLLLYVHQDI
jgi:hypothetical protein